MIDHLQLELPGFLSVKTFLAQLAEKRTVVTVSHSFAHKTYYDSFDWRLYSGNLICELNRSKTVSELRLLDSSTGNIVVRVESKVPCQTPYEFKSPVISKHISPLLETRALLPVTSQRYLNYKLNILNKDEKIVLRLIIESYDTIPGRVFLESVKGYERFLTKARKDIMKMGLTEPLDSVLVALLKTRGRKPNDYSSKLNIEFDPAMRCDAAVKQLYEHLLKTIKATGPGVVDDIDSEFLHDFRVAVRRTRSGLSQLRHVLPAEDTIRYGRFFKGLGQITNQTRDLDVYLLKFEDYKKELPITIRDELNPLYDFLHRKKQAAQESLALQLKSSDYNQGLIEWEEYLHTLPSQSPGEPHAHWPIKRLADLKIGKAYRRIIKNGQLISNQSPAEALHELRKACKKLRYLMEFFQNLYPEKKIKPLINSLKKFQEILGEFQDLTVQEQCLKDFSVEMMDLKFPPHTLLAMGVLIHQLDKRKNRCREAFASQFNDFEQQDNQIAFHALFNP